MTDQQPLEREAADNAPHRRAAFVQIVALEGAIIFALWLLGRLYS